MFSRDIARQVAEDADWVALQQFCTCEDPDPLPCPACVDYVERLLAKAVQLAGVPA